MKKMQITNPSDVSMKSIKVKPEEKQSGRHLSRNLSTGKSSREVYYGNTSIAIPFRWETQPGTPKINYKERSYRPVPPLTPPPSFQSSSPAKKLTKKHSKPNLFKGVLPKLSLRKNQGHYSPASSLSSSTSSSSSSSSSPWRSARSVPSSPSTTKRGGDEMFSRARSSLKSRTAAVIDDESHGTTTLCFGIRRGSSNNVRALGCSASLFKLMLDDAA